MTYKISVSSSSSYSVKQQSTLKFKVSQTGGASQVASLSDLSDVNISGAQNGFVLSFNSSTGKFVAINPDDVLSNAVTGGLPSTFTNELDTALDDKIDLDGGAF